MSDVRVVIERKRPVTGPGESLPLLLVQGAKAEIAYTECESVQEVEQLAGAGSLLARACTLLWQQAAPPQKVAVCGGAASAMAQLPAVFDKAWRQLVVLTEEDSGGSDMAELASYLQAAQGAGGGKVLFAAVGSVDDVTPEEVGGCERLFCLVDPKSEEPQLSAAAVVGASAGKAAGSFTYKNLRISGVAPAGFSSAELAAVHDAGCACVCQKAGDTVLSEGCATSGEYLDVVDAKDHIVWEIEYRTQKLLNQEDKVPYDNNGIALLESVCVNVLAAAFANGMIAEREDGTGDYSVLYAPRSETAAEDREMRRYVEGKFEFALAGAVHSAVVVGTIVV